MAVFGSAGAARSVPRVDSITVFSEPMAIKRQGVTEVPVTSASSPPPVKTSAALGEPMQ